MAGYYDDQDGGFGPAEMKAVPYKKWKYQDTPNERRETVGWTWEEWAGPDWEVAKNGVAESLETWPAPPPPDMVYSRFAEF